MVNDADRHHPGGLCPPLRTELAHQRRWLRAPTPCRSTASPAAAALPAPSSTTRPCCWPATASAAMSRAPGLLHGGDERVPPLGRVLLAARRRRRRVRRRPARSQRADRRRRRGPRPWSPASTSRRRGRAAPGRPGPSARRAAARSPAGRGARGRSPARRAASRSSRQSAQRRDRLGRGCPRAASARGCAAVWRDLERRGDLGVGVEAGRPSRAGSGTCACSRRRTSQTPVGVFGAVGVGVEVAHAVPARVLQELHEIERVPDALGAEPEVLVELADRAAR